MELPKIFSVTDWLSRQNPKVQAQFEMLFFLGPFFVGWFVFLYYWVFLLWSAWDSLPVPSVIMCVGYMLYFRWVNMVRNEATSLDALNMTLDWNESISRDTQNVVDGFMSLKEHDLALMDFPIQTYCSNCGEVIQDVITNDYVYKPTFCPYCGLDLQKEGSLETPMELNYTRFYFRSPMWDPEGTEFKEIVFIHEGDKDKVFRKQPHQWFSHGGQVFPTSTGNIRATYVGFAEETSHIKFFYVSSSPELTRKKQIDLGFIPVTADPEVVQEAMIMSSNREAIHWAKKWKEEHDYNTVLSDSIENVTDKSYRGTNKLIDDIDRIREQNQKPFWKDRENWTKIVGILIVGLLVYWLLNAYIIPWIVGPSKPSPPITNNTTTNLILPLIRRMKKIV